jgi:hypothetical protein
VHQLVISIFAHHRVGRLVALADRLRLTPIVTLR